MNIQHETLYFDPDTGSIGVRYFNDEFPSGYVFNIDLPIVDGRYPNEEELNAIIEVHKPVGQLTRIVDVKNAVVPNTLSALQTSSTSTQTVQDKAAEVRAIRDTLLKQSDYTQLPDSPFSEVEKQAWTAYRQELRELPDQAGFPETVVFPIAPNEEPR